jgi:hypothetical protein
VCGWYSSPADNADQCIDLHVEVRMLKFVYADVSTLVRSAALTFGWLYLHRGDDMAPSTLAVDTFMFVIVQPSQQVSKARNFALKA